VVRNSHRPLPQVIREAGGAELRGLASQYGPRAHELANSLRLSTAVLSQDLSGVWITIQGVRASQGKCLSIGSDRS
jgi:hypothetical protein